MMELEKEKVQQNSRMEQLVAALLRQMGGGPAHSEAATQCRDDTREGQQACSGDASDAKHTGEAGQARGVGSAAG